MSDSSKFATYPSLRDRVVVISGGASGIGAAIVEASDDSAAITDQSVPNALHRHMRVGLGYLRYRPNLRDRPPPDHRSQIDHSVSTEACVTADAPTLRS